MTTILIVDDEKNIRRAARMVLEGDGMDVLEAESAELAMELLRKESVDLVLLDVRLPGQSGVDALPELRALAEGAPFVMMSGHASVGDAVLAVQRGATDFLEKPLDRDRMLVSLKNALRTRALEAEVRELRARGRASEEMVGTSDAMTKLFHEIEKVAPTKARVLITGESGTGKELIARAIHRLSPRADAPFIKVNCAAIPRELLESELFGHERGAFTGAQARKRGLFELADGGTLFLDEIGDLARDAQAKVLRVLQSGELTRVGGERVIRVDVRVLAATHRDLDQAVAQGEFREDLYFRLNVVPIRSPSLRERRSDIRALTLAFVDDLAREHGLRAKEIDEDALALLEELDWPGNVRELRNVVERLLILSDERITLDDLPEAPRRAVLEDGEDVSLPDVDGEPTLREYRERAERHYVAAVLARLDGNVSRAAHVLGLERTNLHKKMKALGIRREGHTSSRDESPG